jgi:hypothetical protein
VKSISCHKANTLSDRCCWSTDEGTAGLLAFFQEIKRELPFFLYLLSRPNKGARKVDSDDLRNLAGKIEGASTDCATKVKSAKGLVFCVGKQELGAS